MMKVLRISAGATLLSGLILSAWVYWSMTAHGADLQQLAIIAPATHRADVEKILGAPASSHTNEAGERWTYGRWTWCMVQVDFAPDGTVVSVEHDH